MHSMQPAPLVHRDIKSPNLLVGADDTVKIADFGLSRVQLMNATMTGQKGTWQWMAPEVLGSQRYAESADMYSYGVVVWELCCRDVPFRGMHSIQAAMAVMNHTLTLDVPAFAPPVLVSIMCASLFVRLVWHLAVTRSFSGESASPRSLQRGPQRCRFKFFHFPQSWCCMPE